MGGFLHGPQARNADPRLKAWVFSLFMPCVFASLATPKEGNQTAPSSFSSA